MPIVSSIAGNILDDVYIVEVSSPPAIQGVPAGIVGLVGTFQQGVPTGVYSISDYATAARLLGPSSPFVGGPVAIQNLLRQGCGDIKVVPVFGPDASPAVLALYDGASTPNFVGQLTAAQPHPQQGGKVPLIGPGPNGWSATVTQPATPNGTFNLTINGSVVEKYTGLTAATWQSVVNANSTIVIASGPSTPAGTVPAPGSFQFIGGNGGGTPIGQGDPGAPDIYQPPQPGPILDSAMIGDVDQSGQATGLALLATLGDGAVNLIFPAEYSSDAVNAAFANFATRNDCMAALCAQSGSTVSQTIAAKALISQDNVAFCDGWSICSDADLASPRVCAPTALVMGMASQLGPQLSWGNKAISGTQGLAIARSRLDLIELQEAGVLCLANSIPAGGFGTRSGVASDGSDLYVRRMRYFLEFSVMSHMGWAVDALQSTSATDPLRQNISQAISTFLEGIAAPLDPTLKVIDTYSVTCNKSNNPDAQIAAGQLSVRVVVRLLAAAKQIVISCDISTSSIVTTSTVQ